MLQKFNTNFLQFFNFNPVSSLDLRFECRMGMTWTHIFSNLVTCTFTIFTFFFSHPRQSMRFKPPPPNSDIGWRVEFRPCELQISDYENAAVACFVVLLTRVILSYGYNLLVPISKIDENMKRAQKMDAIVKEKFFFRTNITATCDGTEENEQQAIIEGT